jgi:hypothetical protein
MTLDQAVSVGHEALRGQHRHAHRQRDLGDHASIRAGGAAHAEVGVETVALTDEGGDVSHLQGFQPADLGPPVPDPLQPSQRRLHPRRDPIRALVPAGSARLRTAVHAPDINPHHRQSRLPSSR